MCWSQVIVAESHNCSLLFEVGPGPTELQTSSMSASAPIVAWRLRFQTLRLWTQLSFKNIVVTA